MVVCIRVCMRARVSSVFSFETFKSNATNTEIHFPASTRIPTERWSAWNHSRTTVSETSRSAAAREQTRPQAREMACPVCSWTTQKSVPWWVCPISETPRTCTSGPCGPSCCWRLFVLWVTICKCKYSLIVFSSRSTQRIGFERLLSFCFYSAW